MDIIAEISLQMDELTAQSVRLDSTLTDLCKERQRLTVLSRAYILGQVTNERNKLEVDEINQKINTVKAEIANTDSLLRALGTYLG